MTYLFTLSVNLSRNSTFNYHKMYLKITPQKRVMALFFKIRLFAIPNEIMRFKMSQLILTYHKRCQN